MPSQIVSLVVNGEQREFIAAPGATLLASLRESLGLTAAKRGCAQGTCGTCTVLVDGRPEVACLVAVETVAGCSVRTLEGVAAGGELDEVQSAFVDCFATQCGFCTAGMIMVAEALLDTESRSERGGRRRGDLGQRLPVHRLPAHRDRHPGRGQAPARTQAPPAEEAVRDDLPARTHRHEHLRRRTGDGTDGSHRHRLGRPALRRARARHRAYRVLRGRGPAAARPPEDAPLGPAPRQDPRTWT